MPDDAFHMRLFVALKRKCASYLNILLWKVTRSAVAIVTSRIKLICCSLESNIMLKRYALSFLMKIENFHQEILEGHDFYLGHADFFVLLQEFWLSQFISFSSWNAIISLVKRFSIYYHENVVFCLFICYSSEKKTYNSYHCCHMEYPRNGRSNGKWNEIKK